MKAVSNRQPPAAEKLIAIFAQLNFLDIQNFQTVPARLFTGSILAAFIAFAAHWRKTLSISGALTSIVTAAACSAAGWSWAWILIAFFSTSTILSRIGETRKRAKTADIVEKGGERDAWQVFANGGLFAALAIVSLAWPGTAIHLAASGAIASSTADTWSTEIGTLSRGDPRSIVSWKKVPVGTSGGVSLGGSAAQICGALFVAALVMAFHWPPRSAIAAFAGGLAGSLADSLLGATVQGKRWCEHCKRGTERALHGCGNRTVHLEGLSWMGNDVVNLVSALAGAAAGLACLL